MQIVELASVASSNLYCEVLDLSKVEDFTCFWALEQTAGIGQRGNHWAAAPGENLTFSLVLHPTSLSASRQFKLTQAVSLSLIDFLQEYTKEHTHPIIPQIKWPNDIYIAGKKICGTLVSTRLQGEVIASAICGIGLNINQFHFPEWVPNPTSLALLTGRDYPLEPCLRHLLQCIEMRYTQLLEGNDFEEEYLAHLLNLNIPAQYRYLGKEITATITGIDLFGRLLLTDSDGRRLCCAMKEISLIESKGATAFPSC